MPAFFSHEQKLIYHCIFSRSCDGFVRQRHIEAILSDNYPFWAFPFILKVSDEYVMEIVEIIYEKLRFCNTTEMKEFCLVNLQQFIRSHDRMISYWNEFYRERCFRYKNYVGKKLYENCFGYTRSMEKKRLKDEGSKPVYWV